VRLAFAGDLALALSLGRWLDRQAAGAGPLPDFVRPGFPFDRVASRIQAADLAMGNLECVFSPRGEAPPGRTALRCSLASLAPLRAAGFDLVTVANNHALDFGAEVFRESLQRLERGGMAHVGSEAFFDRSQPPRCFDLRPGSPPAPATPGSPRLPGALRVGVLGYNTPGVRSLHDVAAARSSVDVLVVFPHWGAENYAAPTPLQREWAPALIDAGADLVVGTHAHVLQPVELHRGKLIAYGLGNFAFPGMDDTEAHRTGALLEVDFDRPSPDAPAVLRDHRLRKVRLDAVGVPSFVE